MLLGANWWWACLNYAEWATIANIRQAALYGLYTVTNLEFFAAVALSGLGWESERFYAFVNTYGLTRVEQPLPPPLDVVWLLNIAMWNEIEAIVSVSPEPEFCDCEIFKFKGNQGGAWPVCWP